MTFHQDIGFQPAQTNPLAILPSIQALREIQGQNALGAAYQQAVDPTTGRIDQAKLANALAASNAPWMVGPGGIQAGQSMEAQGLGTQQQLTAQQAQLAVFNGLLSRYDLSQPHYAPELQSDLSLALKGGMITPQAYQQGQQMISTLHPGESANDLIRAMRYMGQSASDIVERYGPPTVGQQAGILSFLNSPVQGGWTDDRTGQTVQGTLAQYLIAHHQDPASMWPGVMIDNQGRALPSAGGAGGGISTLTSTGRPGGGGGAGAAGGGPYGQPSTLPPADVLSTSRSQFTRDQAMAAQVNDRTYALEQALDVLRRNPNLQTVGHDEVYQLQKLADSFGLNVDMTNAKDFDVLAKSLNQYLQYLPNANRSDLATLSTQAGLPHMGQARPAMEELLAKAIGLERMKGIGYDWFVKQHGGDVGAAQNESGLYTSQMTSWRSRLDPVALAVDHMDPDTVRKYFDSLGGSVNASRTAGTGDKWRFIQSYLAAKQVYPWLAIGGSAGAAAPGQ